MIILIAIGLVGLVGLMACLAWLKVEAVLKQVNTQISYGVDLLEVRKDLVTARMYLVGVALSLVAAAFTAIFIISVTPVA